MERVRELRWAKLVQQGKRAEEETGPIRNLSRVRWEEEEDETTSKSRSNKAAPVTAAAGSERIEREAREG